MPYSRVPGYGRRSVSKVTIVKRLLIYFVLFALAILATRPVVAQSSTDAFPTSMLGFLETGTHMGLRYSFQGQGNWDEYFVVQILDNDGWTIANDSRLLPLEELRKKHPDVESLASKTLVDYQDDLPKRMDRLPQGKRYADPDISISVDRSTILCTVVHVGEDYVLVSYGGADAKRRVLPKHLIKSINWDDGLPALTIQSKVVDAAKTEPSDATESR